MKSFKLGSRIRDSISNNIIILQNFSYLSIIQLINFIIPLLVYPHLIKILGSELYGLIIFFQSIMAFITIFIGFGFNIIGTKNISIYRNSKEKINEILSLSIILKTIVFVLACSIMTIISYYVDVLGKNRTLFLLSFWMCINEILFPTWYFQGVERMRDIAIISVIGKFITVIFIFIFIRDSSHYIRLPSIYLLVTLVSGIISFYILTTKDGISFHIPKLLVFKEYMIEAKSYLISNLLVALREKSGTLIIGSLMTLQEVAYYDLAQKIIELLKIPFVVLKDAIFPNISRIKNLVRVKKYLFLSLILSLFAVIIINKLASPIVIVLGGTTMTNSVDLIRILSFTLPISIFSMYLGISLIIFRKNIKYSWSVFAGVFSYLATLIIYSFVGSLNLNGILLAVYLGLITEMLLRLFHTTKLTT